ncbi:type 1 glutamine amidotransferase domain-containing protein [Aggregatimonas sangjinii]|uniref:Type 1 glutamine amidotransferase domain-containing protein n=1 Tax=Aggregatimonas sangjinii TaxID=2583587 RepID=A0A5B7SY03_9FLAO|nr:type 1 glutamine amidotransferase domain-containing protein [Aggregatimonas sangjinii]QCX02179.1 type 1 glutamine amidotransferase domain-containing protein [Aggregatimonas sangjinii]
MGRIKNGFVLLLVMICFFYGCAEDKNGPVAEKPRERILFIVSNAHFYGDSNINASNHFAEIVHAYDVFTAAGFAIDFVSPEGGAIPIGYINTSDSLQKRYLYDNTFMDALETTKSPDEIKAADYKAVYYGGGGAAMFGVPENESIQKIVMELYEQHKGIISAICHGTAGIVNLKTQDGNYVYAGKKVNGFPDVFERKEAEYYKTFPFSIQERIKEGDGNFMFSEKGWDGFYQLDGRLITGQDPSSAAIVAEKILETLEQL